MKLKQFNICNSIIVQGNARRLLDKRCDANGPFGKISKLGLAPFLWCVIFVLLVTYTHSVIIGRCLELCTRIHFPFFD